MSPDTQTKQRLRVWLRLLAAQRGIEARLREKLRNAHGFTLPRFDVMAALDRYRDGLRMSDLSTRLKVSNGNVTGIVDRLAAEGLVERSAVDGDRRAMLVRLTDDGIARFADMAKDHEGWVNDLLAPLGKQDLDLLIPLLDRIGDRFE